MPAKGKANKNHGNPGADVIDGQASDEFVDGKSGDDAVSGGSGNDWVKGGSGNDLLTYTVEGNLTSSDQYDGGSGIDDLLLDMTFDSWMRLDVQDDIARYLPWLEAHLNKKGMATGQSFEFDFAPLLARKIETLRVRVDGVELNPEDEAVTLADDAFAWTEDQVLPGGNVLLNDDVPDLVRSVELVAGPAVGSISIDVSGQFSYDYGDSFQYLSLGESAFMSFNYRSPMLTWMPKLPPSILRLSGLTMRRLPCLIPRRSMKTAASASTLQPTTMMSISLIPSLLPRSSNHRSAE